jgi:hypothetical protein
VARYTAAGCTVLDHDLINCVTVPGIGAGLVWTVFVAGQRSQDAIMSNYAPPAIWSDANQSAWLTTGLFDVSAAGPCCCVAAVHDCCPVRCARAAACVVGACGPCVHRVCACAVRVRVCVRVCLQVDVNAANVGAGLIGMAMEIEVDGVGADLVYVPLTSMRMGGVANPDRAPTQALVQNPDRLRFVMPPGRGEGLSYRVVVRDLVSEVAIRSNPIPFGFAAPRIGNIVNNIQSDLTGLTCPVWDPIAGRNIEAGEGRDVFVLALRGFNFGPAREDGKVRARGCWRV